MIGIDVGGANLKIIDERGVHIHYCPLWEGAPITETLLPYAQRSGPDAAVVMSGELADCFHDKMEGIRFIFHAVRSVFPRAAFYGTDTAFHDSPVPQLAAANWLCAADFLKDRYPDSVLVDWGSTTTDIIPLGRFPDLPGMTDLMRLKKGYLVYTGLLRTTLPAVLHAVTIDGDAMPVSAEHFAIAADAHLVLGHIAAGDYTCDTPDRNAKDRESSLRRLARVACSDLAEIGEENATVIASQFWEAQKKIITRAVARVMAESGASSVITAGIGSAILARELAGTDLAREIGPAAAALPAYAVREVALREHRRVKRTKKSRAA